MHEELRVTVVATGISDSGISEEQGLKLVTVNKTPEIDYNEMDKPPAMREKSVAEDKVVEPEQDKAASTGKYDYLDIPAFLRRQAD